jgi:hypothetical protein
VIGAAEALNRPRQTRNANSGFSRYLAGRGISSLMVARSVSSNNGSGISSNGGANATVRAVQSIVTGNGFGWSTTSGGIFLSYGDNAFDGNTDDRGIPPLVSKRWQKSARAEKPLLA